MTNKDFNEHMLDDKSFTVRYDSICAFKRILNAVLEKMGDGGDGEFDKYETMSKDEVKAMINISYQHMLMVLVDVYTKKLGLTKQDIEGLINEYKMEQTIEEAKFILNNKKYGKK